MLEKKINNVFGTLSEQRKIEIKKNFNVKPTDYEDCFVGQYIEAKIWIEEQNSISLASMIDGSATNWWMLPFCFVLFYKPEKSQLLLKYEKNFEAHVKHLNNEIFSLVGFTEEKKKDKISKAHRSYEDRAGADYQAEFQKPLVEYLKNDKRDNSILACLDYSDFGGQELGGVDFNGASLRYANFAGANLSGANFTGADLTSASFAGSSNVTNVDFSSANLENLAIDLCKLTDVRTLYRTKLPTIQGEDRTQLGYCEDCFLKLLRNKIIDSYLSKFDKSDEQTKKIINYMVKMNHLEDPLKWGQVYKDKSDDELKIFFQQRIENYDSKLKEARERLKCIVGNSDGSYEKDRLTDRDNSFILKSSFNPKARQVREHQLQRLQTSEGKDLSAIVEELETIKNEIGSERNHWKSELQYKIEEVLSLIEQKRVVGASPENK